MVYTSRAFLIHMQPRFCAGNARYETTGSRQTLQLVVEGADQEKNRNEGAIYCRRNVRLSIRNAKKARCAVEGRRHDLG